MRGSIRKRGKKYTIITYHGRDASGKKIQKWHSGYDTKREAEKELGRILGEISSGLYIAPKNITIAEYLNDWLETYVKRNLKETTYSGYKNYITKHINPRIGYINLQKLQPLQLQKMYNNLSEDGRLDGKGGLSGKTILQIHRILSKAFNQAYKLQLIMKKTTDYVDPPKAKKFKSSILKDSDIPRFIEAFKDTDIYILQLY